MTIELSDEEAAMVAIACGARAQKFAPQCDDQGNQQLPVASHAKWWAIAEKFLAPE